MPEQPTARGICQLPGADPDWWFSGDHLTRSRAVDLCGACIQAITCLQAALAADPPVEGIWAGTTPRQRKAMKAEARLETGRAAYSMGPMKVRHRDRALGSTDLGIQVALPDADVASCRLDALLDSTPGLSGGRQQGVVMIGWSARSSRGISGGLFSLQER